MNLFKRSLLVGCIASICLFSTALANTLHQGISSKQITNALKTAHVATTTLAGTNLYAQEAAVLMAQLEYTPSLERRQTNLSEFAEQRQVKHLEGVEEVEALLNSTQVIDAVQQTIEPFGLKINNIADVYTLWWITAWQASEGALMRVDKQTAQAVKQQAVKIWLANPQLKQASDANKQELAEALLIQALLTQAAMNRAGNDQSNQQAVQTAVREGAAASGLALEQMQLTVQGFVIKP